MSFPKHAAARARSWAALHYPPLAVTPLLQFWDATGQYCPPETSSPAWDELFRIAIDSSTSPGAEFLALGIPDNGRAWEAFRHAIIDAVNARIEIRSKPVDWTYPPSPSQLYDSGFMSVVRPFVKNEPHSAKKMLERRYRLIMNTSLVDLLVDTICLRPLIQQDLTDWKDAPVCTGMGHDDESRAHLTEKIHRIAYKGRPRSSDVSFWDWAISRNRTAFALAAMCYAYRTARPGTPLYNNIFNGMMLTFYSLLVLPSGRIIEMISGTPWLSGRLPTADFNSYYRCFLAAACEAEESMAMGDDAVEVVESYQNYLDYVGLVVEEPDLPPGVVEFCSAYFWPDGRCYLTTIDRTTFRLLQREPSFAELQTWRHELRGHPELERYELVIKSVWPSWATDETEWVQHLALD